jgi:hypothetical protein
MAEFAEGLRDSGAMPPLGELGSAQARAASRQGVQTGSVSSSGSLSLPGSAGPLAPRRPISPRIHSGNFRDGVVESGYAEAYAGGATSWLRIESQLQHLEDLVDLPDIEGASASSTLVVEPRCVK